jgi:hypothetical protein
MSKKNYLLSYILIYTAFSLLQGCVNFKQVGSDLGEGLEVDSLGDELITGVVNGLTSAESKKKLTDFVDSLLIATGTEANVQVKGIRDSLLNDYVNKWIQSVLEDAIGESTRQKLGTLREELLGDKTLTDVRNLKNSIFDYELKQYILNLVNQLGPSALNDSTLHLIGIARDSLLGPTTNSYVKAIIDTSMKALAIHLEKEINPLLKGNLSFIQKNASWLLILIGLISIGITGFVWKQKEKYFKMTKMLTYQISEIPDKEVKESLKEDISKNAKTIGLESDLREVLDKDGLLHMAN